MWTNNNFIEFQKIKDKDFFLLRFDCPICRNRNEINFIGFYLPFFEENQNYIWKSDLSCPSCENAFLYTITIYVENEKIAIHVDSEISISDYDVKVDNNSIFYSLDMNDYNQYFMDVYLELDVIQDIVNKDYFLAYNNSIREIKLLLKESHIADNLIIKKLIFSNIITILETYLSDLLITEVNSQEKLQVRLVEKSDIFKNKKIEKRDIFKVKKNLKNDIIEELNKISYHSLRKVIPIFLNVLNIDFRPKIKNLPKDIMKRHDIIHRNGKNKNGVKTEITIENISLLIQEVDNIVQYIEFEKNN